MRAMRLAGASYRAIAAHFDREVNVVLRHCRDVVVERHKMPRHGAPRKIDYEMVRDLHYRMGIRPPILAERFSVTRGTIYKAIRK